MENNKSQYYIAEKQGNTETIIHTSYVVEVLGKDADTYHKTYLFPEYPDLHIAKKNAKWFTKTFHEKTRVVLKKITTVTTTETQVVETLDSTFERKTKVENNKEAENGLGK